MPLSRQTINANGDSMSWRYKTAGAAAAVRGRGGGARTAIGGRANAGGGRTPDAPAAGKWESREEALAAADMLVDAETAPAAATPAEALLPWPRGFAVHAEADAVSSSPGRPRPLLLRTCVGPNAAAARAPDTE